MARKKRKVEKKEEEYEWVPPEFDEKTFLEKDIKGTRALFVTVISCVLFAILAYFLGEAIHWALGFVVLFVGIFLLRYIFPLSRVDTSALEAKSMIGNYALFFLLFIGLWILFMNPPFSDHSDPSIGEPEIWVWVEAEGDWIKLTDANRGTLIHENYPVNITSMVTDNGQLSSVMIKVHLAGDTGEYVNMTDRGNWVYEFNNTYPKGEDPTYIFTIRAEDSAGNVNEKTGSFVVN